jgi:hypothetical protein
MSSLTADLHTGEQIAASASDGVLQVHRFRTDKIGCSSAALYAWRWAEDALAVLHSRQARSLNHTAVACPRPGISPPLACRQLAPIS